MPEVASAFISILPSAKGFGSKLQNEVGGEVDSAGKSIGSKFGTALKFGAGAAIGGAVLAAGFLKGAIGEARDAQKVGALTNAVIKSTGGIANVTAKDVDRLATSISLKTGVDDEAIAAGQNMLLTFGNVRNEIGKGNDIFSQATVAATDMAAAFGGDAVSNSKMLGKALNDPTKGVSALTRVGVSFTEQQKKQIATLQASGNVLGAQKVILGELSKQTAGAAESQATAGEKFKTAFGNLQESVGTLLLPVLDKALTGLTKFVIFLTNDIGPGIAALNGYLAPAITSVKAFFGSLTAGGGAASGIVSTLKSTLIPVLQTAANTFTTVIVPAVRSLASYITGKLIPVFQQVAGIITGRVLPIVSAVARFLYGALYPAIIRVATAVAQNLKPIFDQLVATFRAKVLPAVDRLLAKFQEWGPTLGKVVTFVVKVIGKVLEFAAAILGKVLPVVIRFNGFLIGTFVSAIINVIGVLGKIVAAFIDTGRQVAAAAQAFGRFSQVVDAKIRAAIGFVAAVPGKVKAVFTGAATMLYNAGVQLMQGLAAGIQAKINDAINAVKAGLSKIKGLLPGSPIKDGPLKPWNGGTPGKLLMSMVARGITEGGKDVLATTTTVLAKVGDEAAKAAASAAEKAREKMREKFQGIVDDWRDSLKTIRSDMASFGDTIASAFNVDVFGAVGKAAELAADGVSVLAPATTALQEFMSGLTGNSSTLTAMLGAFDKLRDIKGVSAAFLSSLFQSGNAALVSQLAASPGAAKDASALFDKNADLASTLGSQVARDEFSAEIAKEIKGLREDGKGAPKKFAKELEVVLKDLVRLLPADNPGRKAYLRGAH